MEYPGRVYRHTSREAQRYRARAERLEVLMGALYCVLTLSVAIASIGLFVKWWLI